MGSLANPSTRRPHRPGSLAAGGEALDGLRLHPFRKSKIVTPCKDGTGDTDGGGDDGDGGDTGAQTGGDRLSEVIARGTLNCGVNETLPGFGSKEPSARTSNRGASRIMTSLPIGRACSPGAFRRSNHSRIRGPLVA